MKQIFSAHMFFILIFQIGCATHRKEESLIQREVIGANTRRSLAISTSEPLVSRVAAEIYQAGGNIVDAAVAASLAISVVRPQSTGIGGGGFLLYYDAKKKRVSAYDFRETSPLAATSEMYIKDGKVIPGLSTLGAKAAGVPGMIAGLYEIHKARGKLSWAKVVKPSIALAEGKIPVSRHLADKLKKETANLEKNPELKQIFFKGDRVLVEGEFFSAPALAKTLRKIAENSENYFYRGEFAKELAAWMKANGGVITEEDMANYRVKARKPLEAKWHESTLVGFPPPSSGGINFIQLMKLYDKIPDSFKKAYGNSAAEVEAMKRAFIDRAFFLGDADFVQVPTKGLIADTYISERAREIESLKIIPSSEILPWSQEKAHETTHLSFLDSEGNAIATTQTVNTYFGSQVVIPGTGVILNSTMDDFSIQPGTPNFFGLVGGRKNRIQPGKRPLSSMTPTIVLDSKGNVELVAGAPGGSRIITAVYQVVSKILRDKLPPEKAISACRFHHQWTPDKIVVEQPCMKNFKNLEKVYTFDESKPFSFFEVQVVGRDSTGQLYSLVDPRGQSVPVVAVWGK